MSEIPHVEIGSWEKMKRYLPSDEVDAVVIGTGAGGAPLIARLASRGWKVVALEAGPRYEPFKDFATDEREQSKLFWKHERLSSGTGALGYGANNSGMGVGGSTLHFTAYTPRPHADDFKLRTEFSLGEDWPFEFNELLPYLTEVENFIGVSGPANYPWGSPRHYPMAALPLNQAARLMQNGCEAHGIRTAPAANAALSAPFHVEGLGWRPACRERGYCQAGCNTGAKSSMDMTYLPFAVSHGAEIRAESYVTGFEKREDRLTAVEYRTSDGKIERQKCRHVFICAGGIETPRLLLLHGLANSSGEVGRNFMAHPGSQIWSKFEISDRKPWHGIPGGLISEDFHRAPRGEYAGGYLLQSIGVMPVTYASQMVRARKLWGEDLKREMRNYPLVAGINILGECFPSKNNFLELSDEKDSTGFAKPRIQFSWGENEIKIMEHSEKVMSEIWNSAGAQDSWTFKRGAHVIGTARMGKSPSSSVVDHEGRSHDHPNLFICDNSVFPSALSVNPSLTIMALALRCADRALTAH